MKNWFDSILEHGELQGILTYEQINDMLPGDFDVESLDQLLLELEERGVVVEGSEVDIEAARIEKETVAITRQQEIALCEQIAAIHYRVQSKMFCMGMSGRVHINKAKDIIDEPHLLEQAAPLLTGDEEKNYLDRLPDLVRDTEKQDRLCAELWERVRLGGARKQYEFELEKGRLVALLRQFQFSRQNYERILREEQKPLLEEAILLCQDKSQRHAEITELESIFRMSIYEFVELHKQLDDDFGELDGVRDVLVDAHRQFAEEIAHVRRPADAKAVVSAHFGLSRAAKHYDHKRGYRFAVYARHWIVKYIDEGRIPGAS